MRVLCIAVFSVVTLSVTSAATTKKKCSDNKFNLITINKDYDPYWYQGLFTNCINGNKVAEIPAETLIFEGNADVVEISNFPKVKHIYMDKTILETLPNFVNLPALKKISLSSNRLTIIRTKNFQNVPATELIFSTNRIGTIEDGSFGLKVEEIYLTCNNLTTISPTWFLNPSGIRRLNLGGNKITTVPDYMFKDFVNLQNLELRNNQIDTLGIGSLSGPSTMISLQLAYNKILEIKTNVFGPKVHLQHFDVQYNRLSFLHQDMMDKMTVKNIRIWGNPWQCPCKDIIFKWIDKNNKDFSVGLTRDEDPSCVYALSFDKFCVPYPDEELYNTFLLTFEIFPVKFC